MKEKINISTEISEMEKRKKSIEKTMKLKADSLEKSKKLIKLYWDGPREKERHRLLKSEMKRVIYYYESYRN